MRTALVVDVHNLYLGSNRNYPGRSVNYAKLVEYHRCFGNGILFKIAYGRQPEEKVEAFAKVLRNLGFELRFGGPPYAFDLAVTVAEMVERRAIDHLILGSVAYETYPLVKYVRDHGIYVTISGFNVPPVFSEVSHIHELTDEFVMIRPYETTNADNLPPNISSPTANVAA